MLFECGTAISGSNNHGGLLACKVDYIDTANYEPEDTDDQSGEPSMKNDAKKLDLLHISIIPGSGRIVKDSKKRRLLLCLEADSIRE